MIHKHGKTDKEKQALLFSGADGNIHCHASSIGIGDKGKVPVIGPLPEYRIAEKRKRRGGLRKNL